ncbi:MAG: Hsp70 family protein [Polyangiaceae bacterium]|nr:Hsp70 family protein [Polyangiaceae bacterium]MCW5791557.1 Hsp70 family protein [Polyangiaceae bacterium]
MSGPVVGIDLGTTNTVVGVVQEGQARAIADGAGERLIPSVVSFHPAGNVLVGRQAKERRLNDASNTIYSIKRLIGRSWDSEEVRRARGRFPFPMREGPGQAALVVARGETYTLPEISAFVLRKAKATAEEALGAGVDRAVITVPANFNDLQRAATKVAGRVAGLEVLRILNEPTAAALAYGYGKGSSERIAIYDFGGGTFDVTLLDLSGNVFEVLATAGNTFLGGDDIDLLIAERMAEACLAQHRVDLREDPQGFERLRAAAEQLKIDLTGQPRAAVRVEEVAHGAAGRPLALDFSMTRREFEELSAPLIASTFDVCQEALAMARVDPRAFDQVLLVGGSTRIPQVREQVERFFGRAPLDHMNPDEVVAIGAAIQASALTGAERRRAEIPRPPVPARKAFAETVQLESGHPRSEPPPLPPRRRTDPGVRPGSQTSPGVRPKTVPPGRRRSTLPPVVVQPPDGQEPVPHTAEGPGATRRRQTTGMGLGGPPPGTVAGLGARGRIPTGKGLGPDAEAARGRFPTGKGLGPDAAAARGRIPTGQGLGSALGPPRDRMPTGQGLGPELEPPRERMPTASGLGDAVPTNTLVSASRPSMVDSGWSDPPPSPAREQAPIEAPAPSGEEQALRAKYGNLPLIMPGEGKPTLPSSSEALPPEASLAIPEDPLQDGVEAALAIPMEPEPARAPSRPDLNQTLAIDSPRRPPLPSRPELQRTALLEPLTDLNATRELELPSDFSPESRTAAELREYAAPTSTDEVTLVRQSIVGLHAEHELEDALPVPDLPPPGPPPPPRQDFAQTVRREAPQELREPRGLGTTPLMAQHVAAPQQVTAPLQVVPQHAPPPQYAPPPPPGPPALTHQVGAAMAAAPPAIRELPSPIASPHYGAQPEVAAPLLVDVTPLSLSVETVSGYCDRIITRNTPVPCEETREFVTARDNQTTVRLRVGQGESDRFYENTLLGELELSGLRPAQRGQVSIAVTFALDASGLLNVSARDTRTGQSTSAVIRLVGLPENHEIAAMQARHQAHAM